jgi:hypothetical protein
MLTGWLILSPLSHNLGWAPGPVSSSTDGARGWILWPALAIMTAESILSVSLVAADVLKPYLAKTAQGLFVSAEHGRGDQTDDEDSDEEGELRTASRGLSTKAEEEPSMRVVLGGMAISCVVCVVLVSFVFGEEGIKWWATVVALFLASVFSVLGFVVPSSPFPRLANLHSPLASALLVPPTLTPSQRSARSPNSSSPSYNRAIFAQISSPVESLKRELNRVET